jgi:hypothetical protein
MLSYKHNLGVINSRYCDFEQRVLRVFADNPRAETLWLPGGLEIMLMYLLQDSLLVDTRENSGVILSDMPSQRLYAITQKGRDFIAKWMGSGEID